MNKKDTVVILGHKGMLGHAIWKKAQARGYAHLIGGDLPELDLCDQESVRIFFEKNKPKQVFFLAASAAGITYKKAHPAEMLLKNLQMITNVMECAHEQGCEKMLNICSALVYPIETEMPFREDAAVYVDLGLIDTPYALAKASGMQLARYYNRQYGRKYITAVPCNFFGPFASFTGERAGVVPSLISRISLAKEEHRPSVEVWGSGNACRDLLGVDDVAEGCLFLAEQDCMYDMYNIGSGREYSISEVAKMIKTVVGYEGELVFDITKPEGRAHMMLDTGRIRSMGWKPHQNLEESIQNAYEWYIQNGKEERP